MHPLPSGTLFNAQIPYEIPVGAAQVVVEAAGLASAPFSFAVEASALGIFMFGANQAVFKMSCPTVRWS